MEIDLKTIIGSYAQITLFLLMLSIGLKEGWENLTRLWKQPNLLIRCLIAAFVLVPLAAMAIDALLPLDRSARLGIGAMAICPGAPMLYRKLATKTTNSALAGSFQVTVSLFAILLVPAWVLILNALYLGDNPASVAIIAKQIATVQLIPISIGIVIRQWLPNLADDWLALVDKLSSFLLLGVLVIVLVIALPKMAEIGLVTTVGVVLFIAATIIIGHYLGGPDPETRISIALGNSTRNAGLALALVALNIENTIPILGTISAIALLSAIAGTIYVNFYRKHLPQEVPPDASES
jgi:BASS family bile acid:Na+ symporter